MVVSPVDIFVFLVKNYVVYKRDVCMVKEIRNNNRIKNNKNISEKNEMYLNVYIMNQLFFYYVNSFLYIFILYML